MEQWRDYQITVLSDEEKAAPVCTCGHPRTRHDVAGCTALLWDRGHEGWTCSCIRFEESRRG